MTSKIKDVSELPSWFFEREYKTNLSDIQWYREIRRRQYLLSNIECTGEYFEELCKGSSFYIDMLTNEDIRPDSLIYHIVNDCHPVADLTVGETLFITSSVKNSISSHSIETYEALLESWSKIVKNVMVSFESKKRPQNFAPYERELSDFTRSYDSDALESSALKYIDDFGNPFLSYGKPLNGYPITVDTQFDDKTILKYFENWLKKTRKKEKTRFVRPFNQNDYDDWSYFKIREIFDLETWARIENVKILDRVIAKAVWPHAPDDFSPIDVYRTTARKKVQQIFQFETVVRFFSQLTIEYGEKFLLK